MVHTHYTYNAGTLLRKGIRGPNMLHMFRFLAYLLLLGSQKNCTTGPRNPLSTALDADMPSLLKLRKRLLENKRFIACICRRKWMISALTVPSPTTKQNPATQYYAAYLQINVCVRAAPSHSVTQHTCFTKMLILMEYVLLCLWTLKNISFSSSSNKSTFIQKQLHVSVVYDRLRAINRVF